MTQESYDRLEQKMLSHIPDTAHDALHIYRVLYLAMEIASTEENVDSDVLIAACLLHDIARDIQSRDPSRCHALEGGKIAYAWLLEQGWIEEKAAHVRDCISTHRYRGDNPPESTEAKILFDADKLDAAGAIAAARTIMYNALHGEPLYTLNPEGLVDTAADNKNPSFVHEYNFKLRKIYGRFYTARARELAQTRKASGDGFYEALVREANEAHQGGRQLLGQALREDEKP